MTAATGAGATVGDGGVINVKTARRRMVAYASLADLKADLDRVEQSHRAGTLRKLGNREPAAILGHLAVSIAGSIDGMDAMKSAVPWWLRIVGPRVKGRVLRAPLRPGVRLSSKAEAALWNDAIGFEDAVGNLRRQMQRIERGEKPRAAHPVFGPLNETEWNTFHLRHCELHMSFLQL